MEQIPKDRISKFERLLIQIRKTAHSLSREMSTNEKSTFKKTVKSLYSQSHEVLSFDQTLVLELETSSPDNPGNNWAKLSSEIEILRNFMDSVEHSITNHKSVTSEYIIEPGKSLTSNLFIERILTKAISDIKIIDNYLSDEGIEMLEHANNTIDYSILTTSNNKKKYEKALERLKTMKKGWKGKVEIRVSDSHHDRSIIIDNKTLWVSGPSLDKVGTEKYGFIIQLKDEEIVRSFVRIFDTSWGKASNTN